MKQIPLTQGKFAIVDDEDFIYLNRFSWHWDIDIVATTFHDTSGNNKHVPMHRFLYSVDASKFVLFKNGNKLDHRKENIGFQSRNLNTHRKKKQKNRSSTYKGVSFHSTAKDGTKCYMAYISTKKYRFYLGHFRDEKLAAEAYNIKAKEIYGKDAYQNKI